MRRPDAAGRVLPRLPQLRQHQRLQLTHVLTVCGSLNEGSGNAWLLERLAAVAGPGVEVVPSVSVGDVPHFRGDADAEAPPDGPVGRLRAGIAAADAVVIATPEYAHALPGSLKNALDWIVGSGELYGKRVAVLSAAPAAERGANAREMLERTLRAQGAAVVWSSTVVIGPDRSPATLATIDAVLGDVLAALAPVHLRPAVPGDELGVATVNVRSWREGYRGLLPQADLDALRAEDRAARYTFADTSTYVTEVAVDDGGTIVGFVTIGLGEVCALYVDPAAWRTGVGSLLLTAAHQRLAAAGHAEAILWFLAGNDRAEAFYRRHGWAPDGAERRDVVWGVEADERRLRRRLP